MVNFRRLDLLALSAQRHTLLASGALDKYRENPALLQKRQSLAYAMFSSEPLEFVLRIPWIRLALFFVVFPFIFVTGIRITKAHAESRIQSFQHYRFTALEQRDGRAPQSAGIHEFGLMRLGERRAGSDAVSNQGRTLPCRARDPVAGMSVSGASITLTMASASPEPYDMFYIKTTEGSGTEESDAVRFILEGTNDLNGSWTVVGGSSHIYYYHKLIHMFDYAETPLERGGVLVLDASMPLSYGIYLGFNILFYCIWLLNLLASMMGRKVKPLLVLNMSLQGVLRMANGFIELYREQQGHPHTVHALVMGATFIVAALWVNHMEELADFMLLYVGLSQIFISAYMHQQLLGRPLGFNFSEGGSLQALGFMLVGIVTITMRARVMWRAVRKMEKGKAVYTEVWGDVLENQRGDLEALMRTVAAVEEGCRDRIALQLTRSTAVPRLRRTGSRSSPLTLLTSALRATLRRAVKPRDLHSASREGARSQLHAGAGVGQGGGGAWGGGAGGAASLNRVQPLGNNEHSATNRHSWSIDRGEPDEDDYGPGTWGYLARNVMQSNVLHDTMLRYSHQSQAGGGGLGGGFTPVQTIDQAHAQAFLVNEMFIQVVVRLARLHRGKFRLSAAGGGFGQWHGGPVSRNRFLLGGLKSVTSCVRKLDTAYSRDVSRLLDICRETLYFDAVADLDACLRAIAADEILEVVRVKSTMDPTGAREDSEGALFAGMRFIKVNMKLAGSEEARSLCVDQHVVELLLVLTDIGWVQTDEMCQAYREWRRCKRVMATMLRASRWVSVGIPHVYWKRDKRVAHCGSQVSGDFPETESGGPGRAQRAANDPFGVEGTWQPLAGSASMPHAGGPFPPHGSSPGLPQDGSSWAIEIGLPGDSDPQGSGTLNPLFFQHVNSPTKESGDECSQKQQQLTVELPIPPPAPTMGPKESTINAETLTPLQQQEQQQPELDFPVQSPSPKMHPARLPVEQEPLTPLRHEDRQDFQHESASSVPLAPPGPKMRPKLAREDRPVTPLLQDQPQEVLLRKSRSLPPPSPKMRPLADAKDTHTPFTPLEFEELWGDAAMHLNGRDSSPSRGGLGAAVASRRVGRGEPADVTLADKDSSSPNERNERKRPRRGSLFPSVKSSVSEMQVMESVEEQRHPTEDLDKVVRWLNGLQDVSADHEWLGGETSWGLAVSGEMEELLEGLCRMSALGISDFLDRRFQAVRESKDHRWDTTSLGSVAYSTHPISSALMRWPFQLFVMVVAGVFFWTGTASLITFLKTTAGYAFGPFKHYRLEVLLTRNGSFGSQIVGPGVSEFGIIGLNGCSPHGSIYPRDALPQPVSLSTGNSMVASYPGTGVAMTGWYLHTGKAENSEDVDPAFFSVWGTNDTPYLGDGSCAVVSNVDRWYDNAYAYEVDWCGAKWTKVGSPSWTYGQGDPFWEWMLLTISLPLERGSEGLSTFLLKPPWYRYVLYWVAGDITVAFGNFLAVGSAICRGALPHKWAHFFPPPHLVLASGLGLASITSACHAFASADAWFLALETGRAACALLFLVAAALFQGYNIAAVPVLLWGYALVDNISWLIVCVVLWKDPFYSSSAAGTTVAVLALIMSLLRQKAVQESNSMVRNDQVLYDAQWQSLTSKEGAPELLCEIDELVNALELPDRETSRQFNRLRLDSSRAPHPAPGDSLQEAGDDAPLHPLFRDLGLHTICEAKDIRSPVSSCNQLYCQAGIANILLMERLKEWANASDGRFKSIDGAFVRWRDVQQDSASCERVKWTPMKRHGRAIEKLLRSYNNDPSYLLDIARGCIIFNSLQDFKRCIETIFSDECVKVERVKNRYSPEYDASATGGYRDMIINLRLVDQQAKALGVELHIVEVQLLLVEYMHIKTAEGHQRYVRSRNLAGR